MKQNLVTLYKYNIWANHLAYNSVVRTTGIDPKAFDLLSHIIASTKIWLSRVTNKDNNPVNPWDSFPHEDMLLLSRQVGEDWIKFIKDLPEEKYHEEIHYVNSKGQAFKDEIIDIVYHVINHSTYHRGQIAALVKSSGGVPAVTDYIVYRREHHK